MKSCLSILLPVFNAMPYLPEAIDSLLKQDMSEFEILVLDDGSTDGSLDYVRGLGDRRIRLLPSETNLGLGATLSRGLMLCETEYYARMDADDRCSPSRLRQQLSYLREHDDTIMVGTQFQYFGTAGRVTISPTLPCDNERIVDGLRNMKLTIVHGSVMARTRPIREAGGYRLQGMGEDWDMFLRVAEAGKIANLPQTLYQWRLHATNANFSHLIQQQIGIKYACDCYERRIRGVPELTFSEYLHTVRTAPLFARASQTMDTYSLAYYRTGLSRLSQGRKLSGYSHLALGALCSPPRTLGRLKRMLSTKPRAE